MPIYNGSDNPGAGRNREPKQSLSLWSVAVIPVVAVGAALTFVYSSLGLKDVVTHTAAYFGAPVNNRIAVSTPAPKAARKPEISAVEFNDPALQALREKQAQAKPPVPSEVLQQKASASTQQQR